MAALVGRLDQFAPADRPTAIEAVARLKYMIERPRRWIRRGAIAAATLLLLLASWRYTSDLARERTIAISARAEAESRRAQAEDLIEFMLGDLREKLVPVGRLDILDDVGERSLQYVGSLNPETLTAEELTRNSKALNQLGEVRAAQGKLAEARQVFEKSLGLAELAAKRAPSSAPAQLAVATSHFWIGSVYQKQGSLPEALQHYEVYMTVAEKLAKSDPSNDAYQLERAYSHGNVGMILESQGDLRGALEHYRTSYEIKNARLERDPGDAKARAEVARAVNKVGRVQQSLGDLAGARTQFENEVATYRRLLLADPKQLVWKQRLAASLAFLAEARVSFGDSLGALECAEEELAIAEELELRDAANVEWQRNHAVAAWRVADFLRERGEHDRSLVLAEQADALMRRARERMPLPDWTYDLAGIDMTYARALHANGQQARAEAMLRATAASIADHGNSNARGRLAEVWFHLGEMYRARGERAAATQAWNRAYEQLRHQAPLSSDARRISRWVTILARLGRADEARFARDKLRGMGYRNADLEQVCKDEGC